MPSSIENVGCRYCDEEEIYLDVKEEPSLYKIGAWCFGCNEDYGILQRVPRSEIDHVDELFEEAEDAVREYFKQGG